MLTIFWKLFSETLYAIREEGQSKAGMAKSLAPMCLKVKVRGQNVKTTWKGEEKELRDEAPRQNLLTTPFRL